MASEVDAVHSDSLSGASLPAHALTLPPNLQPAQRSHKFLWLGASASVALLGSLALSLCGTTAPERRELQVQGRTVSFSASFAARAGIRTMELRESSFAPIIVASGKPAFDSKQLATITANALGTVRRVAKYEGDSVSRGEVLAEIKSPLQVRLEAAASLAAGQMPRGTSGVSLIRSPLSGVVVERKIITGQSVRGESVAFVIANPDHLALELSLDQAQTRLLKDGDRVELTRETRSASVDGVVLGVSALDAPAPAKVVVRIAVDNRGRALRPGQAVRARIFASASPALVVPNRAVAWIAGQPSVFVSLGHNVASAAPVTLGGGDGEQTEVQFGLASGQRIVSDGVPTLRKASFL